MSIKKPEWRPIEGFEGIFKVSSDGTVVRCKEAITRDPKKGSIVINGGDVMIKPYKSKKGLYYVVLQYKNKNYTKSLGKLVLEAFKGVDPENKVVRHIDGNPVNNSIDNLEWTSEKHNSKSIKIKCLETDEIYDSVSSVAKAYDYPAFKILRACRLGVSIKDTHFMFVDDSLKEDKTIPDLPDEKWKLLEGTNDNYMISNKGRIKRLNRVVIIRGKESPRPAKIIEPKLYNNKAVVHIRIYDELDSNKRILVDIAKQVLFHFTKDYTGGKIKHKNGNPLDCRLENLMY